MSLFDTLRDISSMVENVETDQQQQLYTEPTSFASEFNTYKMEPMLYPNATQYVSPYAYDNWGGVTGIIASFDESTRAPATIIENKIDPNKIYTSELTALRSSAADQIRITKLFEKKLMESLREKDKFGLNENDIMAMQALTAGRSAVTSINKEMINIKKNISELRLKQQMQRDAKQRVDDAVLPTTSGSSSETGHNILDSIFESAGKMPVTDFNVAYDPQTIAQDVDRASSMIDNLTDNLSVDPYIRYEKQNPTTYVMLGQTDDDVEFATYAESGEVIDDYPNPISNIAKIDRTSGFAEDDLHREYPIRYKD